MTTETKASVLENLNRRIVAAEKRLKEAESRLSSRSEREIETVAEYRQIARDRTGLLSSMRTLAAAKAVADADRVVVSYCRDQRELSYCEMTLEEAREEIFGRPWANRHYACVAGWSYCENVADVLMDAMK